MRALPLTEHAHVITADASECSDVRGRADVVLGGNPSQLLTQTAADGC